MNNAQLHKALRDSGGRLILVADGDTLWATNHYWMVQVDSPALASLLSDFNLPVEPMVCDVDRTIRRTPAPLPENVATLAAKYGKRKGLERIVPHALSEYGSQLHFFAGKDPIGLWRAGDAVLAINPKHTRVVEALAKVVEWKGNPSNPHDAVSGFNPDGDPIAHLMPVRIS